MTAPAVGWEMAPNPPHLLVPVLPGLRRLRGQRYGGLSVWRREWGGVQYLQTNLPLG